MQGVKIILDTKRVDGYLRGKLDERGEAIVAKTAFDIQGRAQNYCRKDTGACANSIYVVTVKSDGYNAAAAAARAARPKANLHVLPAPKHELEAYVGPSVDYGVYVEWLIEPYLTPAVAECEPAFRKAWGALFD